MEGHFAIDPKLLEILVCPLTKAPLRYDQAAQELISDEAGSAASKSAHSDLWLQN